MLTGIIFWFINAPDPRFGFGFILGSISLVAYLVLREKHILISKNILLGILIISSVATLAYTVYRFKNFFNTEQLITPLGIPSSEFKTFDCNGIKINSPLNAEFGETPIPCTDLDCEKFSPKGIRVEDGFKAR
jgi:hypothetical protein